MSDQDKELYKIRGLFRLEEIDRINDNEEELARLMSLINTRFARNDLGPEEVYLFPSILSTQAVDAYGTRMAPSTLVRFAQDVANGIPLMNSHRTGGFLSDAELPLGRKFDAAVEGDPIKVGEAAFDDQRGASVMTWNYMLRGVQMSTIPNDDIIRAIDAGTIADESVGFTMNPDGVWTCGICGRNYYSMDCEHIVFMEYEKTEDFAGGRCFVWVEDANAVEGSLVYAGATPGAMIRKAQKFADELDIEVLARLEDLYQTRLKDPSRKIDVPGHKRVPAGSADLEREESGNPLKEVNYMTVEEIRALLGELGHSAEEIDRMISEHEEDPGEIVRALIVEARDRVDELEADADLGREVREEIIEKVIKARIQAQGERFKETHRSAYEATLRSGSLVFIRAELETWETRAAEVLSAGRPARTRTEDEAPTVPAAPSGAYR